MFYLHMHFYPRYSLRLYLGFFVHNNIISQKGDMYLKHYCEELSAVLAETQSSPEGLTSTESAARLQANGKNKLAEAKKDSLLKRFIKQLMDPMILILLAAAAGLLWWVLWN